ncbi:unnamed protein product [Rotaria sp. Silwood2]|nr:unnamed protein product [Rotaria sp. Silwood2]CAF3140226.1 unnamed protein product [Rotaria sp. Silwood2]CAF4110155.1 unnamed protein product [Rotaria sp. Silwood2]CAF4420385.1 unnamed protein product [Rotaria sp. Silwood2]CAF4475056.1 unnamed protein product [Rotaria sp. Silwood2]
MNQAVMCITCGKCPPQQNNLHMCNKCNTKFEDNMKPLDDVKEDLDNYLNENQPTTMNNLTKKNEREDLQPKTGHLTQMTEDTKPVCCHLMIREKDYAIQINDNVRGI